MAAPAAAPKPKTTTETEPTDQAPEEGAEQAKAPVLSDHSTRLEPDVDVVAMPSRKASGEADQTEDFIVVGEGGLVRDVDDVEAEAARAAGTQDS